MKKQILNTIGLAVAAALFCVTCSDNGLTKNPNSEAGDANALTGKFYGKDNPTDPCTANPTPDCPNYCQAHPDEEQCKGDPCADPTPDCPNYCLVYTEAEQCKGDPCAANPTPDCPNYCQVYPTVRGCPGYCDANPNAEGCRGEFKDSRDGRTYKWVTIGTQTWMAENLNYHNTNYNTTSKCYKNDPENCVTYGRLYTWSTAMNGAQSSDRSPSGVQGACPAGWHIPSNDEWMTLTNYVGYNAGTKLKSSTGWNSSNGTPEGTDEYGFSALPGGYGYGYGSGGFYTVGNYGLWWSATEYSNGNALFRRMYYDDETVYRNQTVKTTLYSVRCVQN